MCTLCTVCEIDVICTTCEHVQYIYHILLIDSHGVLCGVACVSMLLPGAMRHHGLSQRSSQNLFPGLHGAKRPHRPPPSSPPPAARPRPPGSGHPPPMLATCLIGKSIYYTKEPNVCGFRQYIKGLYLCFNYT